METTDSIQALEMARSERPDVDLLLTDIVMPKVNGRSLADAWKLLHPNLKVLYISGYAKDPQVGHMLAGIDEVGIPEPYRSAMREYFERGATFMMNQT